MQAARQPAARDAVPEVPFVGVHQRRGHRDPGAGDGDRAGALPQRRRQTRRSGSTARPGPGSDPVVGLDPFRRGMDRGPRRHRALQRPGTEPARRRQVGRAPRRSLRGVEGRAAGAPPRRRRPDRHPDALRPAGRDHPGDAVRRPARELRRGTGPQRSGGRPRHHPQQHQPPGVRADDHRQGLPGEDQRQHRQLGRDQLHRRGGGQTAVGHPVGRRHRHGPVHRRRHPHHPRMDHPQLPRPDRHRAHLPGAGEGQRRSQRADLGDLPRHRDRAVRAGRGLHDHPRRRAAALRAADRQPGHRHRVPRRLDHGRLVPGAPPGELPVHALRRAVRNLRQVRRRVLPGRRPAARVRRRTPTTPPSSPSWTRWPS